MDDKTNIKQLKEMVKAFCEERDWDQYHNAKDLAIGIITESSELLEHFRFKSTKEVDDLFKDKFKKEMFLIFAGDACWISPDGEIFQR